MPVHTRTQYICDRCGWDSETARREVFDDFGHLYLSWNGSTGGYGWDGSCGGSSHQGKAYLCLQCTWEFLSFIKPEYTTEIK